MTPRERQRQRPSRLPLAASPLPLTAPQRALLQLINSYGTEGISAEALLVSARAGGFDDLTIDDVRGPSGLQALLGANLVRLDRGQWSVTRAGKETIARS